MWNITLNQWILAIHIKSTIKLRLHDFGYIHLECMFVSCGRFQFIFVAWQMLFHYNLFIVRAFMINFENLIELVQRTCEKFSKHSKTKFTQFKSSYCDLFFSFFVIYLKVKVLHELVLFCENDGQWKATGVWHHPHVKCELNLENEMFFRLRKQWQYTSSGQ